jgi:hypothetical protein
MKNSLKKCLLAGLFLPLAACAPYYQGQSGYYPNTGGYGGGWQRGYYGNGNGNYYNYNNRSYGNFQNYRQQNAPVIPRWGNDHDERRQEPSHHQEWNNRSGGHHFRQDDHERNAGNSFQQHQKPSSDFPRNQQQSPGRGNNHEQGHQDRGSDRHGQSEHHRGNHNRD